MTYNDQEHLANTCWENHPRPLSLGTVLIPDFILGWTPRNTENSQPTPEDQKSYKVRRRFQQAYCWVGPMPRQGEERVHYHLADGTHKITALYWGWMETLQRNGFYTASKAGRRQSRCWAAESVKTMLRRTKRTVLRTRVGACSVKCCSARILKTCLPGNWRKSQPVAFEGMTHVQLALLPWGQFKYRHFNQNDVERLRPMDSN